MHFGEQCYGKRVVYYHKGRCSKKRCFTFLNTSFFLKHLRLELSLNVMLYMYKFLCPEEVATLVEFRRFTENHVTDVN